LPLWLMAASLTGLTALSVVIWQVSGLASARVTFNLPFLSSRPCVAVMLLVPLLGSVAAVRRRARTSAVPRRG